MDKKVDKEIIELGEFCVQHGITLQDIKKLRKEQKEIELEHKSLTDYHIEKFQSIEGKIISSGDLSVDFKTETLLKNGNIVPIHEHELLILRLLVANPKETILDDEILALLSSYHRVVTYRSMIVYVSRLSKIVGKSPINDDYIKRHWKRGYYWNYRVSIKKNKVNFPSY